MEYREFASDLLRGPTLVTASPEENEELMQRHDVNQVVRQLGEGSFRSDMVTRGTERAELIADRFSKACSMYLEPPPGCAAILFLRTAGAPLLASGENVANEKLVVFPEGSGTDLVTPDLTGSESIVVPGARLVEMMNALCPTLESIWQQGVVVIQGDTARLQTLRQAVLDLVLQRENPHPERVSGLIAETLAWIGRYSDRERPERLTVNGARRRVAKLAQQFIEDNHRNAFHLEDLCHVAGIGVRTLQRSFREYFDITITEYLKTVRLKEVHRELSASSPVQGSVTKTALEHGFTHLGRFSIEYRERFGESPRETLGSRAG